MDEEKLNDIRDYIVRNVIRCPSIMFDEHIRGWNEGIDLVEIIASLYNELHEAVTGERYDYMFHWANKVGSDVNEDIFKGDIRILSYRENVEAIIETNLPQIKDEVKETMVNRIVSLRVDPLLNSIREDLKSIIKEDYAPCSGGFIIRTISADAALRIIDKYRKESSNENSKND